MSPCGVILLSFCSFGRAASSTYMEILGIRNLSNDEEENIFYDEKGDPF